MRISAEKAYRRQWASFPTFWILNFIMCMFFRHCAEQAILWRESCLMCRTGTINLPNISTTVHILQECTSHDKPYHIAYKQITKVFGKIQQCSKARAVRLVSAIVPSFAKCKRATLCISALIYACLHSIVWPCNFLRDIAFIVNLERIILLNIFLWDSFHS